MYTQALNLGNGGTENSPLNFKKKDFDNAKMMDYNQNNPMMYKPMSHEGPGGEGHGDVDEFGTPIPEGFVDDTRAYDFTVDGVRRTGEYSEEAPSETFFNRQRRANEALNIAEGIASGDVSMNLASTTTDYPSAAGLIVGGAGVESAKKNIARLRKLSRTNPVEAFEEISRQVRRAPYRIGEKSGDFQRLIDPLNQYQSGDFLTGTSLYYGNQRRKNLGVPKGQTVYEKMKALKGK